MAPFDREPEPSHGHPTDKRTVRVYVGGTLIAGNTKKRSASWGWENRFYDPAIYVPASRHHRPHSNHSTKHARPLKGDASYGRALNGEEIACDLRPSLTFPGNSPGQFRILAPTSVRISEGD